ncbi:MAG TPA: respiratory nitrate reductase subunit gamma [Desulfatiglandales bacterium]|nr:respiratory nitrate reductase subunit gamma [Desulfatiglandales bacterium]
MNYEMMLGSVFYLLSAITTIVCVCGVVSLVRIWMLGKGKSPHENSPSKWMKSFLGAILFQRQILEYGFIAWLAHILIFYGFMMLFVLTATEATINWLIAPHSEAVMNYFKSGEGALIWAFWGDIWGLVLMAGIILALIRRYIFPPETFNTILEDSVAIWFLFVVAVTGWVCEVVRLVVRPETYDAAYSFAAYWLIPFLSGFNLSEMHLAWVFWIHVIVSLVFVAYIPFSKFTHVIASPLVYSFVTAEDSYTKEKWLRKERRDSYGS